MKARLSRRLIELSSRRGFGNFFPVAKVFALCPNFCDLFCRKSVRRNAKCRKKSRYGMNSNYTILCS